MSPYLNEYQITQILTASPEQILIMLYDGAVRFITQADEAIAAGDVLVKREKISKALAIISELSNTLDHETDESIAQELDGLYSYMIRELIKVNLNDDRKPLEEIKSILLDLKEAWMQAIDKINAEAHQAQEVIEEKSSEKPAEYKPLNSIAL